MLLGLQDPDLDPLLLVRIRILPSSSKKSKKNLDFYGSPTSLLLFIVEDRCKNVLSKSKKQKPYFLLN